MQLNSRPLKLVAAIVVIAVAGSFALTASAQPMGAGMRGGMAGHGPMMDGSGAMHLSERMLDRVNATPEQRTQIKAIVQAAATDLKAQHESGRALRQQAMQLFAQPNVDARAVEASRQQMLAQHDVVSKRMTQALLEASRVLTPEQRKQLADGMQRRHDMMERHRGERRVLDAPKS